MRKKSKIIKVLILIVFITSIFSVTVFAIFNSSDTSTNKFKIGSIEASIAEDFTPNNSLQKETVKQVKIENTGKNNEILRVSIIPRWVDENGKPWLGNTDFVKLNLDTTNVLSLNELNNVGKNKWINGNDGYYYYSSILSAAKNTDASEKDKNISPKERYEKSNSNAQNFTSQILNSVSLNEKNMSTEDLKRYEGKKLIIDVNVEAIEPNSKAIESNWNSINSNLKQYLENLCK